jgi:DNA mismatch repair protein MutL
MPDTLANQIAAGEVIQRPASVVKELMENAVDAGAKQIQLVVRESGKQLIQIIDDGCGMSEPDARMCFEKHATSKIRSIEDLFRIQTMGFRGEALASVAAIAQVELRTRLHDHETGTLVEMEGMKLLRQEQISTLPGTSISVKNLFFNVPARRQFLKSDSVEFRHITDDFIRIALAHPDISFRLFHNNQELYHLRSGNLKQRIIGLFGDHYAERIIPIEEQTYGLKISGFAGKPEAARKTRGEQFLFVNGRYIRSAYLNHAVSMAYENILAKDHFPFFVLFIQIDPARIDVNVHPQKYEIKFEDERLVYTFLNKGIMHSLGAFAIAPSIDFSFRDELDRQGVFNKTFSPAQAENTQERMPNSSGFTTHMKPGNLSNWKQMFEGLPESNASADKHPNEAENQASGALQFAHFESRSGEHPDELAPSQNIPRQIHRRFILSQIRSGLLLVDQQAAHERILFEKYLDILESRKAESLRRLFPVQIELPPADASALLGLLPELCLLGFDIQPFGSNSFILHALPAGMDHLQEKALIDELLEYYREPENRDKLPGREKMARALARSASVKTGQALSEEEMRSLIDELFACKNPYTTAAGKKTFIRFSLKELENLFAGR